MAQPNPDAKLRVLVCDDLKAQWGGTYAVEEVARVLNEGRMPNFIRNITSMEASCVSNGNAAESNATLETDRFEITWVNGIDYAVKEVRSHEPPYYSLVVYAAQHIHDRGGAKQIAQIRRTDSFLPQMTVGDIARRNVIKASRAGCQYDAETPEELLDNIKRIFRGPKNIPNLVVVKRGGSMDDLDRQVRENYNLQVFCELLKLRYSPVSRRRDHIKKSKIKDYTPNILLTTGAGQIGLVIGEHTHKYTEFSRLCGEGKSPITKSIFFEALNALTPFDEFLLGSRADDIGLPEDLLRSMAYDEYMQIRSEKLRVGLKDYLREAKARALDENARMLFTHLGEAHSSLITPHNFYYVDEESIKKRIPIFTIAPHYILARDGIPLEDSDTHTVALAEHFGAKTIVLVKRTDGIYDFDPYRGFVADPLTGKCRSMERWAESQRGNRRHEVVTVDQLLSGDFSREGTDMEASGNADGTTDHLMEKSALDYFRYCRNVEQILVTHIAPQEMYRYLRGNTYQHIITGDTIHLGRGGWAGVLSNNLNSALNGKSLSRIVK